MDFIRKSAGFLFVRFRRFRIKWIYVLWNDHLSWREDLEDGGLNLTFTYNNYYYILNK